MDDAELEAERLYDPSVDDPSRAALLRRCLEIGLSVDELRAAGDDLMEVAVLRIYTYGENLLTLPEVAGRAGIPVARAEQIARASGLGDDDLAERLFTDADVEAMATFAAAEELIGADAVLGMLRVTEQAMARIGDAAMSMFLTTAAAPAMLDDESGVQLIEANVAASQILPEFGDWMTRMLLRYLQRSYRPMQDEFMHSAVTEGVDTQVQTIGFADLADSTAFADGTTLADLSTALDGFERTATETIRGLGARVVKFIGDEVMFRADDAKTACAVALQLVERVGGDPHLPHLRVGVAHGQVLSRDGDFFGPTVNLAARITKLAPTAGVVVSAATADQLGDTEEFSQRPLGAIEMKGISAAVELVALTWP